jgi:RNA polymerase sigma-70 factor, ECF subfamily
VFDQVTVSPALTVTFRGVKPAAEMTIGRSAVAAGAITTRAASDPRRTMSLRKLPPPSSPTKIPAAAETDAALAKSLHAWRDKPDAGPGRRTKAVATSLASQPALPLAARSARIQVVAEHELTDSELLLRVGHGDGGAFETFYRRYARPVFGLALRRLGDRTRAEEAVQETFTSVWRSARTYKPERGPGAPWLYAVARNAIVDGARSRVDPLTADSRDEPSGDDGPPERAEQSWTSWRVHRALEELPETERVVLELAYWQGLSQSEIAGQLKIPLGTVKTRTRSGLHRLADLLEGEFS